MKEVNEMKTIKFNNKVSCTSLNNRGIFGISQD